jgi:anti-sigma B factor antagonist
MTTPLTLSTRQREDGRWVLTAAGEIDMSNADSFRDALAAGARTGQTLLVDLTAVEYLDSAGLTALFTHADRIELIATPLLAPVLNISGLHDITRMHGIGDSGERPIVPDDGPEAGPEGGTAGGGDRPAAL